MQGENILKIINASIYNIPISEIVHRKPHFESGESSHTTTPSGDSSSFSSNSSESSYDSYNDDQLKLGSGYNRLRIHSIGRE